MSTRLIRKRYRRVIPVKHARLRESYLMRGLPQRYRRHYPLYESASTIYNSQNLLECLMAWNEYSSDVYDNIKNTADILKLMASHEESTDRDITEATKIICNNILPYVENPSRYEKIFNTLTEEKLQDAKASILDRLYLLKEYDRILENYKILNNKFNVLEYFNDSLKNSSLSESLYNFCDIIENNFNLEYPSSFCVAMESALYALDHIVVDEVDKRAVSEGIIDYYLINGGNEDLNAFAESLDNCLQKDEFLPNEINDYLLEIQNVLNKDEIIKESIEEYFDRDITLQTIDDYNDLMKQNCYEAIQEFSLIDKVKDFSIRFKSNPKSAIASIKSIIHKIFITRRLEDLRKETFNACSLVFYIVMGISFGVAFSSFVAAALGVIVTINLSLDMNKEYLKESIAGWAQHKRDVENRLKHSSGEERKKLEAYLDEVDNNIKILTNQYEKKRDQTSKELSDLGTSYADEHPSSDLTNPLGYDPLQDAVNMNNFVR